MKCIDCKFAELAYLKGYDGTGVYQSHVCKQDICAIKLIDAEIERECAKFQAIKQMEAAHA